MIESRRLMGRVLIIDDEDLFREDLAGLLRRRGLECYTAATGEQGLLLFQQCDPEVVLCDIKMPDMHGVALLDEIMRITPSSHVIMITAFGDLDTAITAFRKGACDYIMKPIVIEDVLGKVKRLIELKNLTQEVKFLRRQLSHDIGALPIIGQSDQMKRIFRLVNDVAPTRSTVLITGESGTGKEVIACMLHDNSAAKEYPFLPINCAGIPPQLLESELFGHVRGSFTGAVNDHVGLFEMAGKGTILLDEIAEMPLPLQSKLLRVLEQREFFRVGGSKPKKLEARIIAATNRDLREQVSKGEFREDLYFRINVFEIHLPPLRERPADIPLLVEHFITKLNSELTRHCLGVDNETFRCLMAYAWPGNVRELRNIIERAMIINRGEYISIHELPESIVGAADLGASDDHIPAPDDLRLATHVFECEHIRRIIADCNGNKEEAARRLGVNASTLYRKLSGGLVRNRETVEITP